MKITWNPPDVVSKFQSPPLFYPLQNLVKQFLSLEVGEKIWRLSKGHTVKIWASIQVTGFLFILFL